MIVLGGATAGGTAVLWSVGVGTAVAPVASCWGSRLIASVVVIDATKKSARMSQGALNHREQATPSKMNSQLGS